MTNTHFIIHSQARQGTHMVRSALGTHQQVLVYNELLHPSAPTWADTQWDQQDAVLAELRDANPEQFFAAVRRRQQRSHVGWCLHSHQLFKGAMGPRRADGAALTLAQQDWLVLDVARKNLLEAFVSWTIAMRTNGWTYELAGKASTDMVEFRSLDWHSFVLGTLEHRKRARLCLQSMPTCLVWYEGFVRDSAGTLNAIQGFLGLTVTNLQPVSKRQERRPVEERFTNWDAVKQELSDTDWEGCLYDDPPNWAPSN